MVSRPLLLAMLCAGFLLTPISGAFAQSTVSAIQADGRILSIRASRPTDVQIVSRSGRRRQAHAYDYLSAGDQLLIAGGSTSVSIETRAQGRQNLTSESPVFVVRPGAARSFTAEVSNFLSRFDYLFDNGARPIWRPTVARGDGSEAALPAAEFAPLISGPQAISRLRPDLIPIWRGEAALVRVATIDPVETRALRVFGKRFTRVALDPSIVTGDVTIEGLDGGMFSFAFERVADVAVPTWIETIADPDQRVLVAAVWLATDAPSDQRLEGFSRLIELSETSAAAEQILAGLIEGTGSGAAQP